jgi:hypothetical protein
LALFPSRLSRALIFINCLDPPLVSFLKLSEDMFKGLLPSSDQLALCGMGVRISRPSCSLMHPSLALALAGDAARHNRTPRTFKIGLILALPTPFRKGNSTQLRLQWHGTLPQAKPCKTGLELGRWSRASTSHLLAAPYGAGARAAACICQRGSKPAQKCVCENELTGHCLCCPCRNRSASLPWSSIASDPVLLRTGVRVEALPFFNIKAREGSGFSKEIQSHIAVSRANACCVVRALVRMRVLFHLLHVYLA